jgi:hypothetical protein
VEEYSADRDKGDYYSPPVDMLDKACKTHDICYYQCRQDFPCSLNGRHDCMAQCDWDLMKTALKLDTPYGISWMGKEALAIVIEGHPSDPGANADFCPMPPTNLDMNQIFNGW